MSPEIFAGVGQPVEQSPERTIYAINCQPADGEPHDLAGGVMQCYHLFPGIDLAYTQFRAGRCRMRERAFSDVLEIAYCQAGRFECEYKQGFVTFLGEGDFAVSVLSWRARRLVCATFSKRSGRCGRSHSRGISD